MTTLEQPAATTPRDTSAAPVRLAILDDHEVLLDTLSTWVGRNAPDFTVALVAPTWMQLVHSAAFPTDLVLLDFQLKEPVSIEARVRTCRAAGAKVIVLSSVETPEARDRALAAGAAAFLAKSLSMTMVMDTARRVMGLPIPTSAAGAAAGPAINRGRVRPRLSPGETRAFRLYVAGYSTTEVAERMNVQYETAKTYLRRVREKYAKAGRPASRKAELIRRAAEDGYLD